MGSSHQLKMFLKLFFFLISHIFIYFCPLCLRKNIYIVEDEFHFVCMHFFMMKLEHFTLNPSGKYVTTVNMFYNIPSSVDKRFSCSYYQILSECICTQITTDRNMRTAKDEHTYAVILHNPQEMPMCIDFKT